MILTGKCKEDFELYLSQEYGKFETTTFQECASAPQYPIFLDEINLPESIGNALIIEFFDSVGIIINVKRYVMPLGEVEWYFIITGNNGAHLNNHVSKESGSGLDCRKNITEQAIKKANEIYNSLV